MKPTYCFPDVGPASPEIPSERNAEPNAHPCHSSPPSSEHRPSAHPPSQYHIETLGSRSERNLAHRVLHKAARTADFAHFGRNRWSRTASMMGPACNLHLAPRARPHLNKTYGLCLKPIRDERGARRYGTQMKELLQEHRTLAALCPDARASQRQEIIHAQLNLSDCQCQLSILGSVRPACSEQLRLCIPSVALSRTAAAAKEARQGTAKNLRLWTNADIEPITESKHSCKQSEALLSKKSTGKSENIVNHNPTIT